MVLEQAGVCMVWLQIWGFPIDLGSPGIRGPEKFGFESLRVH